MAATAPLETPAEEQVTRPDTSVDLPWWHPGRTVNNAVSTYRGMEKRLARQPLARLSTAVPRTLRWINTELRGSPGDRPPGLPPTKVTPALIGHVAMDEAIMALAVGPNRFPRRADYHRVGEEMRRAQALFEDRGWLKNPVSFHQTPPPLEQPSITRGWALGKSYERLWWPSEYEPHLGVPGTDRWLAFEANRTASAWILRHKGPPRPWVVCIHGFGTGSVFMDLFGFHAKHLHDELGLNLAAIVLPVHGARKPSKISGDEFLSFELMNSIHGVTQGLWDIRRLLSWVRSQDPTRLGVCGVSLGGLMTSLVAAFDPDLDMALAGIPMIDFPKLVHHHSPLHLRMRSIEHNILDGTAQDVHRVISPLAMPVVLPKEKRAIFAGLGDRLTTTEQAYRLWQHWDEPEMHWFAGNHVGYLWSDSAWAFVDETVKRAGLIS